MNAKDLIEHAAKELDQAVTQLATDQVRKAFNAMATSCGTTSRNLPELESIRTASEQRVKERIYESMKWEITDAIGVLVNKFKER